MARPDLPSARFTFTFTEPLEGPGGGFTLAHLDFVGRAGSTTSTGWSPDQSMMLAPSLADLIRIVSSMVSATGARTQVFSGASASKFELVFTRRRESITVSQGRRLLHDGSPAGWRAVAQRDLLDLGASVVHRVPAGDSSVVDLAEALSVLGTAPPRNPR